MKQKNAGVDEHRQREIFDPFGLHKTRESIHFVVMLGIFVGLFWILTSTGYRPGLGGYAVILVIAMMYLSAEMWMAGLLCIAVFTAYCFLMKETAIDAILSSVFGLVLASLGSLWVRVKFKN